MTHLLTIQSLTPDFLPAVVELDQKCFAGGLWTIDGYKRELDSPNSDILLILEAPGSRGAGVQGCRGAESKDSPCPQSPVPLSPYPQSPIPSPQSPVPNPPLLAMGCQWAILDEAHITIVAVCPNYQHQGLGQAMLLALLSRARQRGLERATLEVKASNQPAISLYQKFGFKVAGRRRGYYQDTGEDALILWLNGLQKAEFTQTLAEWEQRICLRLAACGWVLQMKEIANDKEK
ncbi:ribosomal-protein-alanine N-acetyltransferase [[Phormidium ambiguum] IAM M-71]|uniref:Ribosomal-protein-alanine N-acetyltransferase n=1 Tax=[Phormidium ambiguum] IAM M-71 TaxID=454136 RepID=A0A1U7IJX1_9CYAN|nr:ribosomal protein S18-alanine N-acetyltransferase [Phormidium ambiguum]OKH37533.1 ribosomal-protein-alanine N-acetyltransferase [Phormidium ambiguum IAM M-71]